MADVGLLLLTRASSCTTSSVASLLELVSPLVLKRLYVALTDPHIVTAEDDAAVFNFTAHFYRQVHTARRPFDVRLLLSNIRRNSLLSPEADLLSRRNVSALFVDHGSTETTSRFCPAELGPPRALFESDTPRALFESDTPRALFESETVDTSQTPTSSSALPPLITSSVGGRMLSTCQGVVLGGTFDRLHDGHKILLSTAALLTTGRLTCGVTDGDMLNRKKLPELIQNIDVRLKSVIDFLEDVSPGVSLKVVPITDSFGPSTVDTDLDAILVSQETQEGGRRVNSLRALKGMSELSTFVISLAQEEHVNADEETKISSSNQRKRLLGTLLKPPKPREGAPVARRWDAYVVGLTGGIATGKSHMNTYLTEFGCHVIDADKLAHTTYLPDGAAYRPIIDAFGLDVVGGKLGNKVDRKTLAKIVFTSPEKRKLLESIVWPVMEDCVIKEMESLKVGINGKRPVVVLDAAVLLEAGWHLRLCDEVWAAIIPYDEAVRRVRERDAASEEQAKGRLSAQLSNAHRVSLANVVLCSLWDYQYTKAQVKTAFDGLMQRI